MGCSPTGDSSRRPGKESRLVSLAPAVTETLVALKAQDSLVGISDHCRVPAPLQALPRVGSGYSPRLEAIALTRPTRILALTVRGVSLDDLRGLGPVEALPWLTLDDIIASTRRLGQLVNEGPLAEDLARRYQRELDVATAPGAPSVLLALAQVPGQLAEVWFIRDQSVHGNLLRAAGGRNAVTWEVTTAPRLSLEQTVMLDPDMIVLLDAANTDPELLRKDWMGLSGMRAIAQRRLGILSSPEIEVPGPALLRLLPRLRAELLRLRHRSRE